MSGGDATTSGWSRAAPVIVAGLVGAAVCIVVVLSTIRGADPGSATDPENHGYVRITSPPRDGFDVFLNRGDAQAYYALAHDPTLSHPEEFLPQVDISSFSQRPLMPYLLWATSFGQSAWMPTMVVVLSGLGAGAFVAANAALLLQRYPDKSPLAAIALLALPGTIAAFQFGPNLPALAFATLGLLAWFAPRRRFGWAAVCFALAMLGRDTMVIFPVVLAVHHLITARRIDRQIVALAASVAPYALWIGLVTARLGGLGGFAGRAFGPPFAGLVDAVGQWGPMDLLTFALGVVLLVAGTVRGHRDVTIWIAIATGLLGVFLGQAVWGDWKNFGRVLLPMYIYPVLVLWPGRAPAGRAAGRVAGDVPRPLNLR